MSFRILRVQIHTLSCFIMALCAAAVASNAQAREYPHWYVGISGAVNFVSEGDIAEKSSTGTLFSGKAEYDAGYGIIGAIGFRPISGGQPGMLRFEAEASMRTNDLSSLAVNPASLQADGRVNLGTAMVNAYADFGQDMIRPYLGAGFGAAYFNFDENSIGIENERELTYAYQLMAGFYVKPESMPYTEFGLGYRFLATGEPEFTTQTAGTKVEAEYNSHSLEAGFRFWF